METDSRDHNHNAQLHVAACLGKNEVVFCLINELGCDPNVRGRFGRSVLHIACEGGNVPLVQMLMQNHMVDINLQDDNNDTPLYIAAFRGRDEVVLLW